MKATDINQPISKKQETKILEFLVNNDTYFREEFRNVFEQMTSNIKNDFPLLYGTGYVKLSQGEIQALRKLVTNNPEIIALRNLPNKL